MINLRQIEGTHLATEPYEWAFVGDLFSPEDAKELARTYPHDHYKTIKGSDGEKTYNYDARSLIGMGAKTPSYAEELSPVWKQLAADLMSEEYRAGVARLVGQDLSGLQLEVNLFHYGPGAWMGPHLDLKTKIVTHVLYFNDGWDDEGGGLAVLNSSDISDRFDYVQPLVGNSVVLVRSEKSWHAVTPITKASQCSRRSMTVTFYHPDSPSTMWPIEDKTPLHTYDGTSHAGESAPGAWTRLRDKFSSLKGSVGAR